MMTKQEFINKWNVAYESKEQQIEFQHEMMKDLNLVIEKSKKASLKNDVSKRSELLICCNCFNNHTNKEYDGYCSQSCLDGIKQQNNSL